MSYRDTYEAWLASPALSNQEKAELETHFQCSLYSDFDIALDDIFSGLLP